MKKIITLITLLAICSAYGIDSSHKQTGMLGNTRDTQAKRLSAFCLNQDGNILACDEEKSLIRIITPDNKLKGKWELDFAPQAIECRDDGSVVVAGPGKVALLNQQGKVMAAGELPMAALKFKKGVRPTKAEISKQMRYQCASTSVGWSGDDIFVCARAKTGYVAYRLDKNLKNRKTIITGLRGCCGQMDMTAKNGIIYVAANTSFKVVKYDRDGKKIDSFGKKGRGKEDYFVGCCEPKNVTVGSDGSLYVAESGTPGIHRFSIDGKFLGRVGQVTGIGGCVRVTVAVNKDASRIYMLDTSKNVIRILERNS